MNIQTAILIIVVISVNPTFSTEDRYIRQVKDSCFLKGEAFSCIKYKALKIAKKTFFGDVNNETLSPNSMISLVPLDDDTIKNLTVQDEVDLLPNEHRSFISEWTEIAKYFVHLVKEFFAMKGLKINLPEGARTIEDQEADDECRYSYSDYPRREEYTNDCKFSGRGKKKKLAIMIPLLNLLATMKTKMLLIPILLAVMLIKKLLLIAALLVPSLLSTLKACKHHHPMTHYSYFGSSDSSDFNSDYGSNYAYSSGGGYGKDWPSNRAYTLPKNRGTASPVYITAPGSAK